MITNESLTFDRTEGDVVRARYVQIEDGIDYGGTLTIDRGNAAYVAEQLAACAREHGYRQTDAERGRDAIRVYASGPDYRPIVNVIVSRTDGVGSALMLTVPYAQKLADELRKL